MTTLTHSTSDYTSTHLTNWLSDYYIFAQKAEFNRFGWAATVAGIQGCILSPVLLLTMFYFGGGDWQFLTSNLCFLLVLIPILSVLPMKYIFPTFAFSVVVHVSLILINIL